MPLAEGMVQRPRHIVGQAFRPHLVIDGVLAAQRGIAFEILAHLGGAVMDLVGGTVDVFGSLPDIEVDSLDHGLAHPVGPHDPGAKPLRMVDQDMKRRPLDGNARSLQPDTQLGENIVNEALIARIVCQPVHNVAVRMRGDRVDVWRRVHVLLPGSDLDRRYGICRVPARRRQLSPQQFEPACRRCFAAMARHPSSIVLRRGLAAPKTQAGGGEGGIRTPDRLAPMPHFECGAIDHSATSPGAMMGGLPPSVGRSSRRGWRARQGAGEEKIGAGEAIPSSWPGLTGQPSSSKTLAKTDGYAGQARA